MLRRHGPDESLSSRGVLLLALVPVLLSLAVFHSITKNYFFGDDLLNLYRLVDWGPVRFILQPYSGHILIARNAVFALCYYLFGTHVELYFLLVLLTHCLNVLLVFLIVRLFTRSARLACFGAALWGLSPTNLGTLEWYSVYGQVLVGTGVAWFLYELGRLSEEGDVGFWRRVSFSLVVLATSTFFGTGIGIAMATPVVAFVLMPPSSNRTRIVRTLLAVAVFVPILYFTLHHFFPTGGIEYVSWRLLDKVEVATSLLLRLTGNGISSLLLGVFKPEHRVSPFSSPLGLCAIGVFVLAAAWTLIRGPARIRRQIIACLLIVTAGYASVALGRVVFVVAGREMQRIAGSPRYHYSGPMTLAIILCVVLARMEIWQRVPVVLRNGLLGLSLLLLVTLQVAYGPAIEHHERSRILVEQAVAGIRKHIDAAPRGSDIYIPYPKQRFLGVGPLLAKHPEAFPGWAGVFVVFFPDNTVDGRRVRFVLDDPGLFEKVATGRRSRDLFVLRGADSRQEQAP